MRKELFEKYSLCLAPTLTTKDEERQGGSYAGPLSAGTPKD